MGPVLTTINPGSVNKRIAEALGLDPRLTTNMIISCEGRRSVSVTACVMITDEQGKLLENIFKEYQLVEKDPP